MTQDLYPKGLKEKAACKVHAAARGAFTLVDVLVSMAVIAVLISLLMPSLSSMREAARRVVCSSNARQHALGLAMYADDFRGALPKSKFASPIGVESPPQPQQMMLVRSNPDWDGLGRLFSESYLNAAGVFYCPSHHGNHPLSKYAARWGEEVHTDIFANYHFRGVENGTLFNLPQELALVTDGMRTRSDFNHSVGSNVMRADLSVRWFQDSRGSILAMLPESEADVEADDKINMAWEALDESTWGSPPP